MFLLLLDLQLSPCSSLFANHCFARSKICLRARRLIVISWSRQFRFLLELFEFPYFWKLAISIDRHPAAADHEDIDRDRPAREGMRMHAFKCRYDVNGSRSGEALAMDAQVHSNSCAPAAATKTKSETMETRLTLESR